ncbi:MAG TPA: hypothetical protein DD399_13640 [Alcanivorax sp.]|nr:hypothetical protein [Alcanivorax sp.]
MHLKDLKEKTPADLVAMAEELGVEGASTMRRQDLMFCILRELAEDEEYEEKIMGIGTIEVLQDGFGFLRSAEGSYLAGPDDIYVSPSQIRRFNLRTGDTIAGKIRPPKDGERYFAMLKVSEINTDRPENAKTKILFENLTPLFPTERMVMEVGNGSTEDITARVIDLVAPDLDALLARLHGFTVRDGDAERTLALTDYRLVELEPDWRTRFLAVITNPSIAYILMLVGIYGLILEFSNPGFGIPGVLGAICLLLALYALQMLPVSYVGLGLILLGIGLMVAEGLSPSFGVLGVGGAVALVIGSIMLMDTDLPAFRVAVPVIAAVGVGSLALTGLTVRLAFKAHGRPVVTGGDTLIGQDAVAANDFGPDGNGQVRAAGELWRATTDEAVLEGETVTIRRRDGLTLHVSRKGDKP